MLRVFKPTSPLSVGTYILSPFSAAAGGDGARWSCWAGSRGSKRLRRESVVGAVRRADGDLHRGAAGQHRRAVVARAAHAAAVRLRRLGDGRRWRASRWCFTPVDEAGPARKMAVAGAAIELAAMHRVENDHGIVSEPYHEGRAGKLHAGGQGVHRRGRRADRAWPGAPGSGAVASGTLLAAGSLLTRFGVFEAGMASARDPKYTVVPQRERMAARESVRSTSVTR